MSCTPPAQSVAGQAVPPAPDRRWPTEPALPLPLGGPASEGAGRSADATEPLASSPCGAREPGPPSAAARLSPPTSSCARFRRTRPNADADGTSRALRTEPPSAERPSAHSALPFPRVPSPLRPKAQRRTCPRTPTPTPTPTRSRGDDRHIRASDLRRRQPPPLLSHRRRQRPLLPRRSADATRAACFESPGFALRPTGRPPGTRTPRRAPRPSPSAPSGT